MLKSSWMPGIAPMSRLKALLAALALVLAPTVSAASSGASGATPGAAVSAPRAAPVDISPVPLRIAAPHLPEHWDRGVFMEIFVRAYQDSDGDGIGDLRGLISRLDYLQDLGIRGIWLMPVTRSADRDHGYATTDFRDIEPDYGTLADFDELLKQAHARGIGVITDYVINHASHQHPAFQQALKGSGPDNCPRRSKSEPLGVRTISWTT